MAEVKSGVRTRRGALAAGAGNIANRLLDLRRFGARGIRDLQKVFPNVRDRDLKAIWQATVEARVAGRRRQRIREEQKLPLAEIPRNPTLRTKFRFELRADITNPITGDTRALPLVIFSDANLTMVEIREQAAELLATLVDLYVLSKIAEEPEDLVIGETLTVRRIERR